MAAETKKKDNREVKEKKVVIKKEPIPQLAAGDNVKVSMRIVEGDKERIGHHTRPEEPGDGHVPDETQDPADKSGEADDAGGGRDLPDGF